MSSEELMVNVLNHAKQPLSLDEVVTEIIKISPTTLTGKTPNKSLYSIIYRREKQRKERGHQPLFHQMKRGGATYYSLNNKGKNFIGKRIEKK